MPTREAGALLAQAHSLTHPAGQMVFNVGDPPGGIYGVLEGAVRVIVDAGPQGPLPGHLGPRGAWFGEGAVFSRGSRMIGLVTARPSRLAHVELGALDRLLARDPGVWRWLGLLSVLNTGLAVAAGSDLMLRCPRERCVATLLRLGGRRAGGDAPAEVAVTQSELAILSNLSRSLVAQVLRDLQAAGLVALRYGRIDLLRPADLRGYFA